VYSKAENIVHWKVTGKIARRVEWKSKDRKTWDKKGSLYDQMERNR